MGLTDFQKQVYSLIKKIPKGRISTYGQIARVLGCPNSARLIGRILSQNPYLTTSEFQKYIRNSYIRRRFVIRRKNIARSAYVLKIPCHRVVRSNGQIGGYKLGVKKKKKLLRKEGIIIKQNRISNFNQIFYKF